MTSAQASYEERVKKRDRYHSELGAPSTRALECPMTVLTDSYKAAHPSMYPPAQYMTAYGEYREPFKGMDDGRIVVYGIRHYIEQFISRKILKTDIDSSKLFYEKHLAPYSQPFPFPNDIFQGIQDSGYLPVKIEALPEGSVVHPHTPAFILTTTGENSHLCTFLETILTMIWYPSCVATLSRHTKELIKGYFTDWVDPESHGLLDSRLHDFGFRGCTCVEQSVLGGAAHLLSFTGSDTMSACFHVQFHLNNGIPVGTSIPATEHSVMTSWPDELQALRNLINKNEGRIVACVMDSYDYDNALDYILTEVKDLVIEKKVTLVLRPDSGNPVDQVVKALRMAVKAGFKCTENRKKFKVLHNVAVIQGDGIEYSTIKDILEAVVKERFSPENVAFGMGGGLLQKVNRDTLSFATKLSYIEYMPGLVKETPEVDGGPQTVLTSRDVMKNPATDASKRSLPGKIMVLKQKLPGHGRYGPHMVYTAKAGQELIDEGTHENSMITVFDGATPARHPVNGLVSSHCHGFDDFKTVKERLEKEWVANKMEKGWSPLHDSVTKKQDDVSKRLKAHVDTMRKKAAARAAGLGIQYTGDTRAVFYQNLRKIRQVLDSIQ